MAFLPLRSANIFHPRILQSIIKYSLYKSPQPGFGWDWGDFLLRSWYRINFHPVFPYRQSNMCRESKFQHCHDRAASLSCSHRSSRSENSASLYTNYNYSIANSLNTGLRLVGNKANPKLPDASPEQMTDPSTGISQKGADSFKFHECWKIPESIHHRNC